MAQTLKGGVTADIRADGGVARMSDPELILKITDSVTIPVMAKCRIGHFVEAQILEALGVNYIDESEVLTPADKEHHILKHNFKIPFVCGCRNIGEALRRIGEGAAMIRTKNLFKVSGNMRSLEEEKKLPERRQSRTIRDHQATAGKRTQEDQSSANRPVRSVLCGTVPA